MKHKLTTIVIGFVLLASWCFGQKGITNNGAKIIVTNGGIISISGGADADYTNKTSGGTDGRIDLDGTIKLEGDWTNNASSGNVFINVDTDGTVEFKGSTTQVIGGTATTQFEKLTVNNVNGISLSKDAGVNGDLTLTNGRVTLGTFNLTLGTASTIQGTPSATKMVVATGTGAMRKMYSSAGSFTFPVGDVTVTAEYSPVTLNFTSGTFGGSAYAGVRLTDAKHPSNPTTGAYITRYWSLSQSNISSYSCDVTATYLTADVVGTESTMFAGYWKSPNWVKRNAVNAALNQLSGTLNEFYDITAGDLQMFCDNSPALAYTKTNVSCNSGANGGINLTVSGGLAPYSYSWFTPDGSGLSVSAEDQSGLTAGTYDVTVTDFNGCTSVESVLITEPDPLSTSIAGSPVLCNSGSSGSADLTVTGGTLNYTYAWSNGSNTQDISGLSAGTFTVTVTDANGCIATDNVTIAQPAALTTSITETPVSCNGGTNGSANLTVTGGVSPYTYSWNSGPTTQDISGLSAQTYTVTITDFNSCTVTDNITISQPTAISSSIVAANVNCNGGNDGSADLTPSGGTAPYNYLWSTSATTQDISGLVAGTYSVTITDFNLCTSTDEVTITQPTLLSASISGTNVSCNAGSNGQANLTPSGGTSPYTFAWSNSGTAEDLTGLTAGTYTVTVSDFKSCTATAQVVISQPTALALSITGSNVSCNGGSNGSATITASGGTPNYTYLWSNSATTGNISGLAAATYTLTLTDANLCTITNNVVITQPAALVASISGTDALCFGAANGAANLTATGGTSPLTFAWSNSETTEDIGSLVAGTYTVTVEDNNGCSTSSSIVIGEPTEIALTTSTTPADCGISNGSGTVSASGGAGTYSYQWDANASNQTTATATALGLGTYYVTVTDLVGCTNSSSASVSEVGAPTLTMISSTNVSCNGGNNGTATVEVTSGTPDYTYAWSTGTTNGPTTSTTNVETGLAAGTYAVTLTDAGGCQATASVVITQPTAITSTITKTNVSCFAGSNGTATVAPTGGTPSYTYLWNTAPAQSAATATGLAAGTYTVTISDANGCTILKSTTVNEPLELTAGIVTSDVLCNGGSSGSANLTVSGGTPTYSYNWSSSDNTEDISGIVAGTYTVTVTDNNLCTATASATVNEPSLLTASISGTNVLCNGGNNGAADLTVLGGTASYTYAWSNSATTEDLSSINAGGYSVTVTDANGCTASASVSITEPPILASTLTVTNALCNGSSDGAISTLTTGGTPGYSYNWSNSATSANISLLAAGSYTVTIADVNGCSVIKTATVSQPTAISATTSTLAASCFGASNGEASVSASGGTPGYSYLWDNSATTSTITGLGAGSYSVTVSDANGCSVVKTATVAQPAELTVAVTGNNPTCYSFNNGSASIVVNGGTPSYTYNWSNFETTGNISNLIAGTYTITVTDGQFCTTTSDVTLTEPLLLQSTISGTDVTCAAASNGSVDLGVTGGTTPYTYLWSNASTQQDLSNIAGDIYYVTVSDANGCSLTNSYEVLEPTQLVATMATIDVLCFGNSTGAIDLTVAGGTPNYSFEWFGGETTEDLSNLTAGTYTVTISDNNLCSIIETVEITEPTQLAVTLSSSDASCFNGSNGTAELSASGGTPTYTYLWSTNATTSSIAGLSMGSYSVTVTDLNNCSVSETANISEPTEIVVTYSTVPAACYGNNDGSIDVTVTGGTGGYTFNWSNGATTEDITALTAQTYTLSVTDANSCLIATPVSITQPAQIVISSTITDANCGQSDGQVTASVVSGGVSPFAFQWNDPSLQSTATASGLPSGSYTVVVTDDTGCTAAYTSIVNDASGPVVTIASITDASCFSLCDGSVSATVSGGTTPYSFAWSNPVVSTTETAIDLCAGTYVLTVTDFNNCISTANAIVGEPEELITLVSGTNTSCNGICDGMAVATQQGGTAPFSYEWGAGEVNDTITSLCAAVYDITVTDANGCFASGSIEITQPEVLSAAFGGTDVTCFGLNNGSVDLTVTGGTMPYSYNWDSGETTEDLSDLAPAEYFVTVVDYNGCSTGGSFVVSEPALLEASLTQIDILCNGQSTGSIDLTTTGGTAPLEYSWSNSSITEDVSNLPAGFYEVIVTDGNGCEASANTTLTEPTALTLSYTVIHEDLGNDGEINITVENGTPGYSFAWSNAASTEDLVGLTAGIYTVTATDANGCSISQSISVNNIGCLLTVTMTGSDLTCFNNLSGSATATAANGTEPYSYLWNDTQTTETAIDLAAGLYSVTVQDVAGCIIIESVEIFEPEVLSGVISPDEPTCYGFDNGNIDLTVSGGTVPYGFEWNTGITTEDLMGIVAATYTVTITDENGCSLIESISVNQPDTILSTVSTTDAVCFGENSGTIDLTVSGGTIPYSYAWSNSDLSEDPAGLIAGIYEVTITDGNGCMAITSAEIFEPTAIVPTAVILDENIGNDGAIDISISGGVGPYTFEWNTGETTEDLTNISDGVYEITITDASGCQIVESYSVSNAACLLTATITGTNPLCNGDATGTAEVIAANGLEPYTYQWDDPGAQISSAITGINAGMYNVTVTDANDCVVIETIEITEPEILALNPEIIEISCFGANNGSLSVSPTGGTGQYSILWSNNETTNVVSGLSQGLYSVTVNDENSCIAMFSATLEEPEPLDAVISTNDINCFGDASGNIDLTVSGGIPPYTFSWSTGDVSEDISGVTAGNYFVSVYDNNGCELITSGEILQPDAIMIEYTVTNEDAGNDGAIDITVSGGTPSFTYLWNTSDVTEDLIGLTAGVYSVEVTDGNGCIESMAIAVNNINCNLATMVSSDDATCWNANNGQAVVVASGGTEPYSYLWSDNQTTDTAFSITAGDYYVTVTDDAGCIALDMVSVFEPEMLYSDVFVTNVLCNEGNDGAIDLMVYGGTPSYSFTWNGGENTEDLMDLAAGIYDVTITDANGCSAIQTAEVSEPALLELSSTVSDVLCFGNSTGSVDLQISGGTMPYSIMWNNGDTSEDLFDVAAGEYIVSVYDENGCWNSDTAIVTEPTELTVDAVITNEDTGNDGAIDLTVNGGVPSYTFEWSTSEVTEDLSAITADIYYCTVTDANGCAISGSFVVNNVACSMTLSTSSSDALCFGSTNGQAVVVASNGTEPYSYMWNDNQTTDTAFAIGAGDFSVTVTDAVGCVEIGYASVSEPEMLDVMIETNNITCFGLNDGLLFAEVAGGTMPYEILWSNSVSTPINPGLSAGTYDLTVTDANGCAFYSAATVVEPSDLNSSAVVSDVTCNGAATGEINFSVSGGTVPYEFLWSNGMNSEDLMNLSMGDYSVTVTDENGCQIFDMYTITQPAAIEISAAVTAESSGNDGAIDLTATGGTGVLSFEWNGGETTEDISSLAAGIYVVSVTDENGCLNSASFAVNDASCALTAAVTGTDPDCYGDMSGEAVVTAANGTEPYTYIWSDGQAIDTAYLLVGGVYEVTVQDDAGCFAIGQISINEPAPLELYFSATDDNGSGNGSATAFVYGGTSPYSYLWNDPSAQTTEMATMLTNGMYTVEVNDANGCMISDSVMVPLWISIDEIEEMFDLNIYPNPVQSTLNIAINTTTSSEVRLYVLNELGQNLAYSSRNLQAGSNLINLNTSGYATGVYFIKVIHMDRTSTLRFVKTN